MLILQTCIIVIKYFISIVNGNNFSAKLHRETLPPPPCHVSLIINHKDFRVNDFILLYGTDIPMGSPVHFSWLEKLQRIIIRDPYTRDDASCIQPYHIKHIIFISGYEWKKKKTYTLSYKVYNLYFRHRVLSSTSTSYPKVGRNTHVSPPRKSLFIKHLFMVYSAWTRVHVSYIPWQQVQS